MEITAEEQNTEQRTKRNEDLNNTENESEVTQSSRTLQTHGL